MVKRKLSYSSEDEDENDADDPLDSPEYHEKILRRDERQREARDRSPMM